MKDKKKKFRKSGHTSQALPSLSVIEPIRALPCTTCDTWTNEQSIFCAVCLFSCRSFVRVVLSYLCTYVQT